MVKLFTKPVWQTAAVAVLVFALDQLSKYWLIFGFHMPERSPVVVSENFSLVMAWNRGVSFSMFSSSHTAMPYVLAGLATIVSLVLLRLSMRAPRTIERVAYAMVAGGALGNAIDRVRYGAVPDFFYAHIGDLGWPAFNVADIAISCGVGLLLFSIIKHPSKP